MIAAHDITGLVLAGGRGSRMGGIDKGLQLLHGKPMALHVLERLRPQVGHLLLNANRHLETYRTWDVPVITDADAGTDTDDTAPAEVPPSRAYSTAPSYEGPLAGFLAGLTHCTTPWLLTVACDTPYFPADLAQRLAVAADAQQALIAMPVAMESEAGRSLSMRSQPTFCLINRSVLPSLRAFVQAGGRKIDRWTSQHPLALVPFEQPHDDPHAFANINTLTELALAHSQPSAHPPRA